MKNKKIKSIGSTKQLKENSKNVIEDIGKSYSPTIDQSKKFSKESFDKITKVTTNTSDLIKSKEYLHMLKNNSLRIKEKSLEQKNVLKRQSTKFYKRISNGFFYFFELLVGRIKIGTQYGETSIELLEK